MATKLDETSTYFIRTNENEYLSNTGQISLFCREENKFSVEYTSEDTFHIKNTKGEYAHSYVISTNYGFVVVVMFKENTEKDDIFESGEELLLFKYKDNNLFAFQIFENDFCCVAPDEFGFFAINKNVKKSIFFTKYNKSEVVSQMTRTNGDVIEKSIALHEPVGICFEAMKSKHHELAIYRELLINNKTYLANEIYYISRSLCFYDISCKPISEIKKIDDKYMLDGKELQCNVKAFLIANIHRIINELASILLYIDEIDVNDFVIDMDTCTLKFVSLNKIFYYEDSQLSSGYDNIEDAIEEISTLLIDEFKETQFYKSLN